VAFIGCTTIRSGSSPARTQPSRRASSSTPDRDLRKSIWRRRRSFASRAPAYSALKARISLEDR
jgi:hypothetical protein